MRIIGCDLHARHETVAMLDGTREVINRTLMYDCPICVLRRGDHVSACGVPPHESWQRLPPGVRPPSRPAASKTTASPVHQYF